MTTRSRTTVAPRETVDLTHQHGIQVVELMAPRTEVWTAMLAAHEALGAPATSVDEPNGRAVFLVADRAGSFAGKPLSTYVDCGMGAAGPRASSYRVTLRISETVEAVTPALTRLHTVIEAWAKSPGMSADRVDCSSTGALERHLLGMIVARVRAETN